jgi:hypothetical protein
MLRVWCRDLDKSKSPIHLPRPGRPPGSRLFGKRCAIALLDEALTRKSSIKVSAKITSMRVSRSITLTSCLMCLVALAQAQIRVVNGGTAERRSLPYRLNRRRPATERVSGSATPPRSGPERSGGCAKRFQLSYPGGRTSKPATSFPSISFTNNGRATGKEFPLRQNCRVSLRSLQQRPAPHVA